MLALNAAQAAQAATTPATDAVDVLSVPSLEKTLRCASLAPFMEFANQAYVQLPLAVARGQFNRKPLSLLQDSGPVKDYAFVQPTLIFGLKAAGIASSFGMASALTVFFDEPMDAVQTPLRRHGARFTCRQVEGDGGQLCESKIPVPAEQSPRQQVELMLVLTDLKSMVPQGRIMAGCIVMPTDPKAVR